MTMYKCSTHNISKTVNGNEITLQFNLGNQARGFSGRPCILQTNTNNSEGTFGDCVISASDPADKQRDQLVDLRRRLKNLQDCCDTSARRQILAEKIKWIRNAIRR